MVIMQDLPLEMRLRIYDILDHPSILQMRVINSWFRDDIDNNIGLGLWILTNQILSQREDIQVLFTKNIHSVTFTSNVNDGDGGFPDPEQIIQGWEGNPFVFNYPFFVKTLEFGSLDANKLAHMTEGGLLNIMKDCQNLRNLVVSQIKFYGEALTENETIQLEGAIKNFKELRSVKLKYHHSDDLYTNDSASILEIRRVARILQFISSIIGHCQSPTLMSIEVDLKVYSRLYAGILFGSVRNGSDLLFCPCIATFQMASRHWRTLKNLNIQFDGMRSFLKDPKTTISSDEKSWELFLEDFKKIRNLTELGLTYPKDSFPLIVPGSTPKSSQLCSLIENLISQQQSLQKVNLHLPKLIQLETLHHIVQHNKASLKSISVSRLRESENAYKNVLDMDLFYNCSRLESISLKFSDAILFRRFNITNLGRLPSQLNELALIGLPCPENFRQQLMDCSDRCPSMKKLKIGFTPRRIMVDLELPLVINSFIQKCPGLEYIQLRLVKIPNLAPFAVYNEDEGPSDWEVEYDRLATLFQLFESHEIPLNPTFLLPGDHKLIAKMITPEDRIRIMEHVGANGIQ